MTDTDETPVERLWPDGEGPLRKESDDGQGSALIVDVGGFEGPLDLLLDPTSDEPDPHIRGCRSSPARGRRETHKQ